MTSATRKPNGSLQPSDEDFKNGVVFQQRSGSYREIKKLLEAAKTLGLGVRLWNEWETDPEDRSLATEVWHLAVGADALYDVPYPDEIDEPDFAAIYAGGDLSPRSMYVLWAELQILGDHLDNNTGEEMFLDFGFPPICRRHPICKDVAWQEKFCGVIEGLTERIAAGDISSEFAKCTAEEIAIHLALASVDLEAEDFNAAVRPGMEKIPEHKDDFDWGVLKDLLLEDADVELLWVPSMDGIENSDVEEIGIDVVNLRPEDWFAPFREEEDKS